MNKKLIAVAIAAAVAAPAAMAGNDTTLYGKVHMSVDNIDNGTTDIVQVNDHASRLGVKGSEDLGNGMKAIFKMEMGYDGADVGTGGVFNARNGYVGVAGDFGTVLVGRHDTPAKVAFYASGTEVVGDSVVDINRVGFTEFRVNNAIAYISPNFSGFTAAAAVVPGETSTKDGLADTYSVGLMYSGGGLKASLGYEVADNAVVLQTGGTGSTTTIGANDHEMLQVGASYTMGDFMIGANYQDTDNHAGGTADREVWAITGKATFGNNYLMARYGEMDTGAANDQETMHIAAGHKMSKRTQVYIAYEDQESTAGVYTDAVSLGMIHSF
jgi:predicted porin